VIILARSIRGKELERPSSRQPLAEMRSETKMTVRRPMESERAPSSGERMV